MNFLSTISQTKEGVSPFTLPPFYSTEQEAVWTCEKCGVIQPRYSKSVERWVKQSCECQKAAKRREEEAERKRQQQAGMILSTYCWLGKAWPDENLVSKTFANFDQSKQPEGFASAELFIELLSGTLVLHGVFGTGKTHLLAAVCNHLREHGKESRFTTAPNLFGAIQEAINYNEDYNKYIRMASTTPLLVIDDIDKAKWSEFREEKYFAIIDNRVKRGLPTAISTNRVEELEKFVGGAVASRLSIGQIAAPMNGQDYRKLL